MHSVKTEGFAVKRHELEQRLSDTQIVLNDLREVGRSVEIEQNELDGAKDLLEFVPEKADVVSPPDVHPRHIDVGVPSPRTKHHISAIINGEPVKFVCASAQTLLDVLRDELNLTGSKEGCISGDCGACTVIVDGNLVCSCLMLGAEAEGRNIQTIEGIAEGDKLHPVQQKFLEHAALQCGFCTAGFIVAAKALLDHNLSPTEEETRYWLAGNLCRCTGYDKIIHAVLDAAGELRARASTP